MVNGMKKRLSLICIITMIAAVSVAAFSLTACNKKDDEIVLKDPLPVIEPYKDFDVTSVFENKEGYSYEYSGFFVNDKGTQRDLTFDGSIFKISVANAQYADITIVGKKENKTLETTVRLSVEGNPEPVDKGFSELWDEDIITKTLNYNPDYIKEGSSSVKVNFNGFYNHYGTQFTSLRGHLYYDEIFKIYDTDYFSIYQKSDQEKAWEDAIMTFWVYYANTPKDHADTILDIGYHFCLNSKENLPDGEQKDFDFGQAPLSYCRPNEWTQIAIRFKDLNKLTPLYLDTELLAKGWRSNDQLLAICDLLNFKCRVSHADYESVDTKYSYTFYFDAVDILTYEDFSIKYPDFDFGVDNGNTVSNKFSIESWGQGAKGLAFTFGFADTDGARDNDAFGIYQDKGENWIRLTELINLDFNRKKAYCVVDDSEVECGKIIELGNGKYRYELMFVDATLNLAPGETTTGYETANLIWFANYSTKLLTSDWTEISSYS